MFASEPHPADPVGVPSSAGKARLPPRKNTPRGETQRINNENEENVINAKPTITRIVPKFDEQPKKVVHEEREVISSPRIHRQVLSSDNAPLSPRQLVRQHNSIQPLSQPQQQLQTKQPLQVQEQPRSPRQIVQHHVPQHQQSPQLHQQLYQQHQQSPQLHQHQQQVHHQQQQIQQQNQHTTTQTPPAIRTHRLVQERSPSPVNRSNQQQQSGSPQRKSLRENQANDEASRSLTPVYMYEAQSRPQGIISPKQYFAPRQQPQQQQHQIQRDNQIQQREQQQQREHQQQIHQHQREQQQQIHQQQQQREQQQQIQQQKEQQQQIHQHHLPQQQQSHQVHQPQQSHQLHQSRQNIIQSSPQHSFSPNRELYQQQYSKDAKQSTPNRGRSAQNVDVPTITPTTINQLPPRRAPAYQSTPTTTLSPRLGKGLQEQQQQPHLQHQQRHSFERRVVEEDDHRNQSGFDSPRNLHHSLDISPSTPSSTTTGYIPRSTPPISKIFSPKKNVVPAEPERTQSRAQESSRRLIEDDSPDTSPLNTPRLNLSSLSHPLVPKLQLNAYSPKRHNLLNGEEHDVEVSDGSDDDKENHTPITATVSHDMPQRDQQYKPQRLLDLLRREEGDREKIDVARMYLDGYTDYSKSKLLQSSFTGSEVVQILKQFALNRYKMEVLEAILQSAKFPVEVLDITYILKTLEKDYERFRALKIMFGEGNSDGRGAFVSQIRTNEVADLLDVFEQETFKLDVFKVVHRWITDRQKASLLIPKFQFSHHQQRVKSMLLNVK
jgi:hypothetical protein